VLNAQQRCPAAVSAARDEIDGVLATDGPENVRFLQRALRNAMTEHAGVVRDEAGLRSGLRQLAEIEERLTHLGVHPDIAGFYDLAHAFDLKASAIAARATLEAALERRETRGCHNRSDYPLLDEGLDVNLVWSGPGRIQREAIPGIPVDISTRMREVSSHGKLVE
jgi:succinate dehydrogenase / fumarate reductase flavoprotein subunit